MSDREIDLSFVVPASNENRWSDLLATLGSTDPEPLADLLGLQFDSVHREVSVVGAAKRSDRLDLLLRKDGRDVAVIEAKVLSDLGPQQLDRYHVAFPEAQTYRVLHLAQIPVNLRNIEPWESLTWEAVLSAHTRSRHPWVSATAQAWVSQIANLIPRVGPETVWNAVPDDAAGFELALRSRIAWLSARLGEWCTLEHDIEQSSGGGNWAIRMWTDGPSPEHVVTVELQEGLTAYEWRRDPDRPYRERLPGPVVLLGLRQDSSTSAAFDWALLHRMFAEHILDDSGGTRDGRTWQVTPARPMHPVDKENWQRIVAAGAPRWLGKGWGMKVAQGNGACLFGARFGLPPTSTLAEIETELRQVEPLLLQMSGATESRADG